MIRLPQRVEQRLKISGLLRQTRYPQQPVGFGIVRPAVQRHAIGEQLLLIAGDLPGVEGGGQQLDVPQLIPDGIVFEAEGAGAVIRQPGAAVRVGSPLEEGPFP